MTTIQSGAAPISQDLMDAVNGKKATDTGSVQADEDKFLKLLVTQLKNQDPLNPLDNAQLTSQLAQLSTVTGVNKLNTTLESLKSSYQASESLQAANMIGHGVLTKGDAIVLSEGKSIFGIDLASAADSVKVMVRDRTGKEVQTIALGAQQAGTLSLAWDGATDEPNQTAPNGNYTFEVIAMRGDEKLKDATGLSFGTVASVSTNAQGVKLNIAELGSVTMADIKQIL